MISYKILISLAAVILTFVGYAPYIRDILNKKTQPHVFTWFIFALAGGIACALQIVGGAGVGSWALICGTCISILIFILGLRIGNKDIVFLDIIFLLLSLLALYLWLIVKQPVWSVILATFVEISGFVPTIRKSWNSPYSETLFTYETAGFRHALSIFALQQFNILTLLYPIAWTLSNIIFTFIILARRKIIKN